MDKAQVMKIWGQAVPVSLMKAQDHEYLCQFNLDEPPHVEQIWCEMDKAWDELGLSATAHPSERQLADFYCHPVWVLNGFFSASDPQSCVHREAIAKAVLDLAVKNIADYGGGMGELAIRMARSNSDYVLSIIEPYPSDIGRYRVAQYANISYVPQLNGPYDLVIAQDVLEHVDDPVGLAAQLANATRVGGYLIFANCFYPVIKCHLPSTFHLSETFSWVMKGAGLEFIGNVPGAEHVNIFRKTGEVREANLRRREWCSKALSSAKYRARLWALRVQGLMRKATKS